LFKPSRNAVQSLPAPALTFDGYEEPLQTKIASAPSLARPRGNARGSKSMDIPTEISGEIYVAKLFHLGGMGGGGIAETL